MSSRRQQWPDESTSATDEGVPLLQPENNQKQQKQQQQQYYDPVSMMPPPGSYGTTSDVNGAYRSMPPPPPSQYDYPIPPDPAMAAAMAAAMHQQMQIQSQGSGSPQTAPQPYYFQGYPGGVPSMPHGYPHPPPMQYMQYNSPINSPFPPPPTPQARPPRHERRRSDGKNPSPSPSPTTSSRNKKTFSMPPPTHVVIPSSQGPIFPPQPNEPVHSAIPPLQDIFAAESAFPGGSSYNNNNQTAMATNSMNYGSISANTNDNVYNAPPRAPPRMQPVLVRTSSSQDVSAAGTATNRKKFGRPGHRRVASDTPLRLVQQQRSINGGARDLPPIHRRANSGSSLLPRGRTYSGTNESAGGSRRGHRRTASFDHSVGSMVSQSSVSVVSNIGQSAMYGGIDAGGRVQLHFPLEAVRIQVLDDEDDNIINKKKKNGLNLGHLYMYRNPSDFDQFEEYIRLSEDMEEGIIPQWESLGGMGGPGKRQLLPQTNYTLPVSGGIYKQVVDEIADAHSMPCGLFFCGHHEDVAHPSILIAVGLITILFVALIYAALVTDILK